MTVPRGGAVLQALGLAVVVAATACVPGYTVSEGGEPIAISGRFDGEPAPSDFGNACIWLTRADGTRTYLLLFGEIDPVRFNPLRLIGDDGQIIAMVGDTLTAVGPRGAIGNNGCARPEVMFVVDTLAGPGGGWRDSTVLESLAP
jgi:hypothetical protein